MSGIDTRVVYHHMSINSTVKLVSHRKCKVGEENRTSIDEEVQKLINIGVITEVKYPFWIANIILVRISSNKWRICVDFTELNTVCPKDLYLIPNINRLIDGSSGHKTLSFMDAYFGYNILRWIL